jgi:hypothetical protein
VEDSEERMRKALDESAGKIDGIVPPAHDFLFFKDMVEKQQAIARRAQKRQLMLFVAVAAVLVSALIACMGQFMVFIIALQGAAVMGAITGLAVFFIRNRKLKAGAN